MRESLLALVGALAIAGQGHAAPARPVLKADTPYPEARRQLIKQGFDPVHVLWRAEYPGKCDADRRICRRYSEVVDCATSGARSPCMFLYRQRLTGRYWIVDTEGEPISDSWTGMRGLRCWGGHPATRRELDGLVILTPSHRRLRISYGN